MAIGLAGIIARTLDTVVARARAESPRTAELLTTLAGQSIELELTATPWHLLLESTGATLTLRRAEQAAAAPAAKPCARIIGTPLALLALLGADPQSALARGGVRIEGDTALAQQYRELLVLLQPDLEHLLARPLGRPAAHLLLRAASGVGERARAAAWSSLRSLAEYLAHESGDLVPRPEAEQVLLGVEQLREQLDRLEARLQQLERRAARLGGERETI
jgi:ubiquinone biosynthesis accessory factor UbiJ